MGWIGVDFDGCLAEYHGWKGENVLGAPIEPMVRRVKQWLAEGKEVRIFTARVGIVEGAYSEESKRYADREFAQNQERLIKAWSLEHIGQELLVTAQKDFELIEIWDDRAKEVVLNTGYPLVGDHLREVIMQQFYWDSTLKP